MARKPERYNAIAERNGMTDVDDTMVYASAKAVQRGTLCQTFRGKGWL
jgi:hypothetical protein